ncbi:MAG TPA: c-type cytochrome [Steroidobacteraceae bacterium]|nr:c-type cytochrome [Steroidobacteraceae bacterium]
MASDKIAKATALIFFAVATLGIAVTGAFAAATTEEPLWAYGFTTLPSAPPSKPPPPGPPPDNKTLLHVTGSKLSFTRAQIRDYYGPADWFPEDHPTMPEIVAHGRKTAAAPIIACALCHLPNGNGRPENANVTGLTYGYIVQQMLDFRKGARQTSDKRKTNTGLMNGFGRDMTDEEVKAAATYFASIPAKQSSKVVESDRVPKTRPIGGLFIPIKGEGQGMEALGSRIVEVPVDEEQTETLRNPRVRFIAYVPKGSLAKGEILVRTGDGKVTPCTVCHGADLRGLGPVPRLAGNSPSYLARQLYDMQTGHRAGAWTPLMAPIVAGLSAGDVLAAAAYLGSLNP